MQPRLSEEELEEYRIRWFLDLKEKVEQRVPINRRLIRDLYMERHKETGIPIGICRQFLIDDINKIGITV